MDPNAQLTLLIVAFNLLIPLALLSACLFPRGRTKLEWAARLALAVGYVAFLWVVVPACFFGIAWHVGVGVVLIVGAVACYRRIRPGRVGSWRVAFSLVFLVSGLALAGLIGRTIAVGYRCPPNAFELRSPFHEGRWCVMSGGGSLLINIHNVPNQIYGLDIVRVNSAGRVVNAWLPYSNKLEDYPGFGTPLYSPCDAVVLRAIDGIDDMSPGQLPAKNTAGNLVLLGFGRCKILMGHMKKGSLRVHVGERISSGQLIGQLGNSGFSTFPHLHISFAVGGTDRGTYDGIGVPATFDGRFPVRNSFISAGAQGGSR